MRGVPGTKTLRYKKKTMSGGNHLRWNLLRCESLKSLKTSPGKFPPSFMAQDATFEGLGLSEMG